MKEVLTPDQRLLLKGLMEFEGVTRNQARYRVMTDEQRQRFCGQVEAAERLRRATSPRACMLAASRRAAKRRGIEWRLTEADLQWPAHCPVTGVELVYPDTSTAADRIAGNIATFDRVDNSIPYLPGNVIIVSLWVNTRKGDATPEQLRAIADYYSRLVK